jgi:hypothetical protein
VWGLAVSLGALFFATGARRAAEQARSEEKLRSALERLEDAADKCIELGQYAGNDVWRVVEIRAQEVFAACRTTLAAWGDNEALTESRRLLDEVATLMSSIVKESREPTPSRKNIQTTQHKSYEKLVVVTGKIQKHHNTGSE